MMLKRIREFFFLIVVILLCIPGFIQARGVNHVQRIDIIDRNGFEKPLVATSVLIPAGWRTEGGIVWSTHSTCGRGYNIDFQAVSADGFSGLHIFPMQQWHWSSTGMPSGTFCPSLQITSIKQYIDSMIQQDRPGARMLDYRPRPDIAQQFQHLSHVTPMPMGEMRAWVEAGEALIAYHKNGVDMRESIASAVMFSLMRMQGMAGVPDSDFLTAATFPGFAMRAPNGQLDFKLAEMLRKSAKPGAEWTRRISQHNAKISSINAKGASDRSRLIAKTGDEIRKMQADSWRIYNASSDYLARERSEAIRGVETYHDPYHGGSVELDNSYEYAWQLDDSSYVLTDDANFNPFATTGQNGQRLTPVQ